ncbi:MAG: hypothetical protein JO348_04140, partial [Alphaproteobacteria bacterium]|nr:hypothetical protein [Alphaproteobacteria bacterium]
CDLDHLLRWVEADAGEVRAVLSRGLDADMLVIGRSARTFAAEPKRLQDTERVVNHIYALMTGHEGFDVMFAARRLSRRAAEMIVREAREDTVGNDVEWPLLVERAGLSVAYAAADGLYYRTMEEFGAAADTNDSSALEWVRRIEYAALHAKALRRFLT